MKTRRLIDNLDEARMLLRKKIVFALFSQRGGNHRDLFTELHSNTEISNIHLLAQDFRVDHIWRALTGECGEQILRGQHGHRQASLRRG